MFIGENGRHFSFLECERRRGKCLGRVEEMSIQKVQCQRNGPFSFALAASVLVCCSLTGTNVLQKKKKKRRNGFFFFLFACGLFLHFISEVGVSGFVRTVLLGSIRFGY